MSVTTDKTNFLVAAIKRHSTLSGGLAIGAAAVLLAVAGGPLDKAPDLESGVDVSDIGTGGDAPEGRFMRAVTTGAEPAVVAELAGETVSSRSRRDLIDARISYLEVPDADGGAADWTTSRTRR